MPNEIQEKFFSVAEDIMRLDPWSRDMEPIALCPQEGTDHMMVVVFIKDGDERVVRFIRNRRALRTWLEAMHRDGEGDMLALISQVEDDYNEVVQDPDQMNGYEKKQNEERDMPIVCRKKRPGQPLVSFSNTELEGLLPYLRALRKVLALDHQNDAPRYIASEKVLLQAYHFENGKVEALAPIELRPFERQQTNKTYLDEFTLARLARTATDDEQYELFYFYLPMVHQHEGRSYFPMTAFLVNLNTGVINWSEVLMPKPGWEEALLRKLSQYFFEEEIVPGRILCARLNWYESFAEDMRRSYIPFEKISKTYIGDELTESYVKMAHLKGRYFEQLLIPFEPEK